MKSVGTTEVRPTPKSGKGHALWFVVGTMILAVIVVGLTSAPQQPSNPTPAYVKVQVAYSGQWQGAYGGFGSSGSIVSWNGTGPNSVTISHPAGSSIWIISAQAQKLDSSSNVLTVNIVSSDGSVLKQASTSSPYGVVQVEYTFS